MDYGVVGLKRKLRMGGKVNRRGRKFSRSLIQSGWVFRWFGGGAGGGVDRST